MAIVEGSTIQLVKYFIYFSALPEVRQDPQLGSGQYHCSTTAWTWGDDPPVQSSSMGNTEKTMLAMDKCKLSITPAWSRNDKSTAETQQLCGTGERKPHQLQKEAAVTDRQIYPGCRSLNHPSYPAPTNHPKSFTTTMYHAERLAGTASLLGNAQGLLTQDQKCHPGGLGKRAVTRPKRKKATTAALCWFQPLVPELPPATSPALLAPRWMVTLAEGAGPFPPAHGYILAISRLAAEIYQHHSTMLAG